tara:strand:+ start:374 stop:538 length:165 start_codon:yes stop_codon:yes gene_type:complete
MEVKMDNITKYEFKIQFADDGLTLKKVGTHQEVLGALSEDGMKSITRILAKKIK